MDNLFRAVASEMEHAVSLHADLLELDSEQYRILIPDILRQLADRIEKGEPTGWWERREDKRRKLLGD